MAEAASSLSFLNASRFGDVDTKSCSADFLLRRFLGFGERVTKQPTFASSRLYRFCREFLWSQTGVTALIQLIRTSKMTGFAFTYKKTLLDFSLV